MSNVRRRDDIQPEWDEHVGYDMFARLPECVKWLNDKTYEKIPEADELLATQPARTRESRFFIAKGWLRVDSFFRIIYIGSRTEPHIVV